MPVRVAGGGAADAAAMKAELLDRLLDRAHGQRIAAGVQARRSSDFGDAHRATQLVKHLDFDLQGLDHSLQARIVGQGLQGVGEFEQGNIVLPLAAQMDFLDQYAECPIMPSERR